MAIRAAQYVIYLFYVIYRYRDINMCNRHVEKPAINGAFKINVQHTIYMSHMDWQITLIKYNSLIVLEFILD